LVKIGHVFPEICSWTDRHTDTVITVLGCLIGDGVTSTRTTCLVIRDPIYKIPYDLSQDDYVKFIIRSTYDSDLAKTVTKTFKDFQFSSD